MLNSDTNAAASTESLLSKYINQVNIEEKKQKQF